MTFNAAIYNYKDTIVWMTNYDTVEEAIGELTKRGFEYDRTREAVQTWYRGPSIKDGKVTEGARAEIRRLGPSRP